MEHLDTWQLIALAAALGWASGIRLYAVLFIVGALGYLDFRFASHDWRAKCPKLAKWFATTSKMPSIKATVPPPS